MESIDRRTFLARAGVTGVAAATAGAVGGLLLPETAAAADNGLTKRVIGQSTKGRPIRAFLIGDSQARNRYVVMGQMHGDEPAGPLVVLNRLLKTDPIPDVALWLVPTMNPDGQADQIRHNANGVDLNRNFPERWGPIAQPGDWQYAGPAAASEPETQAMLRLAELVEPDLTLWYHQDLFRITPGRGRDGEIRARYAGLTGLPLIEVTGGTYTGTASQWSRVVAAPEGIGFTVELGPTLDQADAGRHADAVLSVATEL
jgi:protein MpaA